MTKKDLREGEIIAYVMAHLDDRFECETDFTDHPTMSRATAFRVLKGLDQEAILSHLNDGKYGFLLAPRVMRRLDRLIQANAKAYLTICLLHSMMEDLHPFTKDEIGRHVEMCGSCPQEIREPCFRDEAVECPFGVSQSQMRPVSNETRLSSPQEEDPEEESPVSNETERPMSSSEEDPGDGSGPSPSPVCNQLQTVDRPDPRALLKQRLAESKAAERAKPPTMKQQVKEVKEVWDACLKDRYGADFKPPRWGGLEHKRVPELIQTYGLELTKSGILLYFKHWDDLLRENAWITDDTPSVKRLLALKETVFRAAQGKGRIGERVSKRTADEWVDDGNAEEQGKWPAREEEAAPSA
jgi:hypothetical protein